MQGLGKIIGAAIGGIAIIATIVAALGEQFVI